MAKGDTVTVTTRAGTFKVEAEKAGRKLVTEWTKDQGINWLLVHEQTWTGKTKNTTRFAAGDVVVLSTNFESDD